MHIVEGEHAHGHSHAHTHEYTHTHEHNHEPGHENEHTHTHDHQEHGHSHSHGSCEGCGGCQQQERPANEQEAILAYMLDHNKHHAAELLEVAKQIRAAGKEEAAMQIEKAVENFDKGNLYLSVALSLVK